MAFRLARSGAVICTIPKTQTTKGNLMNQNSIIRVPRVPLHILLRRRREELSLLQADVAAALQVSPECVTLWEAGRRRMELSKVPRLAAALDMNPQELCAKALAEFHPLFYHVLFGDRAAQTTHQPL
jgi:DNA-binding XRE family transcriptional regulator